MRDIGAGTRFPRSMLPHAAAERLLVLLGVEIVDDCDAELAECARAWLATVPRKGGTAETRLAARRVRDALERHDRRKRAA